MPPRFYIEIQVKNKNSNVSCAILSSSMRFMNLKGGFRNHLPEQAPIPQASQCHFYGLISLEYAVGLKILKNFIILTTTL